MKTITLLIFKLMLDAGMVVPMHTTNEGRDLYTLFPNASVEVFDEVGLTLLDLQEDGVDGATEEFAHKYFDEALRVQGVLATNKKHVYEHCYKGEILQWIQTLEFSYNEVYPDDITSN